MSVKVEKQKAELTTTARRETRPEAQRHSAVLVLWRDVRLLLIALWLGAAVFFSFAVAPSVFRVLPTRELAGLVVGRTLAIVNVGGFIIAGLLLLSAPLGRRVTSARAFIAEVASLIVVGITTGIGQWVIAAQLAALRAQMGRPIDELAQSDPLRVAFGSLHGYSVMALSVGMLAALAALLLIAHRHHQNQESES